MNKKERETILKLLDENNLDEIRKYIEDTADSKYISSARKTIKDIINGNCVQEHPSYYSRVYLNKGIDKSYKGIFLENQNGFIICDGPGYAFELYNKHILTPEMKLVLERSDFIGNIDEKAKNKEMLLKIFSSIDRGTSPIFCTMEEGKTVTAWLANRLSSISVPCNCYKEAHKLLGDSVEEFVIESGNGLYLKSTNGKALIMRNKVVE